MNLRIYKIKRRATGDYRLVKAGSRAHGLSHVVKSDYDIAVASAMEVAVLMANGVTVENAVTPEAEQHSII